MLLNGGTTWCAKSIIWCDIISCMRHTCICDPLWEKGPLGIFYRFAVFGMDRLRYKCRVQWCKFCKKGSVISRVIRVFYTRVARFWVLNFRDMAVLVYFLYYPCTSVHEMTSPKIIDLACHIGPPLLKFTRRWKKKSIAKEMDDLSTLPRKNKKVRLTYLALSCKILLEIS